MRTLLGSVLALPLAVGLLVARPADAQACIWPAPTVEEARNSAQAILVGKVVWTKRGMTAGLPRSWFDLSVDRVVRGPLVDVLKVRGLRYSGCGDAITAKLGDRIVLAMGVRVDGQSLAAMWVVDSAGRVSTESGARLTLKSLLAMFANPPDTSTAAPAREPDNTGVIPSLIAIFSAALAWQLARPRLRPAVA